MASFIYLKSITILLLMGIISTTSAFTAEKNNKPIIGVVAQRTWGKHEKFGRAYIAADYVQYIESAGGRVVPISNEATEDQLKEIFMHINGVLLPGGGVSVTNSGYERTAKSLFELAIKAFDHGDYFPIWGTCLGFEQIVTLAADRNILTNCSAWDISMPLEFTEDFRQSRLFHNASADIITILKSQAVTANFHHECMSSKTWSSAVGEKLQSMFNVLSSNHDVNKVKFISTIEGKKYPIYATQWHPEKNMFAWRPNLHVAHTEEAIKVTQYTANFFVSEARKNHHRFPNANAEMGALIYNFNPVYTGKFGSEFEQCYFF